ncbi:MAG: S8 family serine peptidase [Actinomycetota bacterium]|nr:S8 family serine peptidase [Actinomycetota bacterium]
MSTFATTPMATAQSNTSVIDAAPDDSVDRLIVRRLIGETSAAAREFLADALDVEIDLPVSIGDGFEILGFGHEISFRDAVTISGELVARGLVVSAEPDVMRTSTAVPNDPRFSEQWYLQTPGSSTQGIDLPSAWDITRGSSSVVVAVIDTGRLDHPELSGRLVDGYDFVSQTKNSKDGDGWDSDETDVGDWSESDDPLYTCTVGDPFKSSSWHGTHVSGIIAANADNSVGIAGVAPNVRVQHVRVLGTCGGRTSDEAVAIRWAAGLPVDGVPLNPTPAKVINLSLGSQTACAAVEQAAIDEAVAAGVTVVVAAGNAGLDLDTNDFAPSKCANVISVAALRFDGSRASYTNYGSSIDVAAPGGPGGILSLQNGGTRTADSSWTYGYKQGTSMSTPIVSGIAALVLSVNPNLTPAQVESIIESSARPFPTGVSTPCSSNPSDTFHCGTGIADAGAALRLAAQQLPQNSTPSTRLGSTGDRFTTNLAVEALADRTDVILVSGSVYPDGLAASALAKQENADIVLVPPTGLGSEQIAAIVRENPQTVWILGGPQAIPTSVETQLTTSTSLGGAGLDSSRIERVFGATRYDTAVEVSKRIDTIAYLAAQPTAIIVRGDSFADAVIAGPAAFGITGGIGSHPVFLVNRDTIPAGVVEQLRARGITNVLVVGGTSVVSEAVRLGIQSLGINTTRVAGPDRYATAAALGQLLITPIQLGGFGWNAGDVALVDISDPSLGFDAISAVGTLGPTRRILLGVTSLRLPASTAAYLATLTGLTSRLTVIGSSTAVPASVITEATRALAS